MSKSNYNNRPSMNISIAALDAAIVLPLHVAGKKIRIHSAKYVQEGAISVSAVNFLTFQLKVDNVAVGAGVDTQAGLAARIPLSLNIGTYLDVEKDSYVALDVAEDGTFAEGTAGMLVLDYEVIGN